ncbi:MAG TPA: exonuclease domain-containing protein [Thermomicrobiaceae bacterium]|nr:exonuclease domain-containing protein [Thermomicrobiaceae bacterium]
MAAAEEESGGYQQLQQRAYLYVREHAGAVAEEDLIGHVFGSSANVALWRPLLRQVMQTDGRVNLRSDGCWAVRGARPPVSSALPDSYVVVDVETTGLRPFRQRLIEVAAIRYRNGARDAVFTTLVNPGRRVPAYISKLTGIDDAQLVGAPEFQNIASDLVRFLEDDLIVGYNVGFDVGFLDAELKRSGHPGLANERLDLLPLSTQLVGGLRRSGLEAVAQGLGIAVRERHRAQADAEITALLLARLIELARERGLTSLDSVRRAAAADVPVPRRRTAVGRGRAVLDRSHLAGIPHAPGVYLMHDIHERVIYVGKAKDLRNRVSSYYSQPLGYTRKMDGLLESIARIEVVQTGSELEALLLESQLIRRHGPQFNTQQRNSESYPYVKVDVVNPWPRVTLTRHRDDDGAAYFGPFRIGRAARDVVDLINEIFPLRTCPRSFRTSRSFGSPCLQLSLGRCPGPCVGQADRDGYRQTVQDVVAFLHGGRDDVIARLHQQLVECAERFDFERAARVRDRIRRVQQLVLSQQLLDETIQRGSVAVVTPSTDAASREVLIVLGGRMWAQVRVGPEDDTAELVARLDQMWRRASSCQLPPVDQDSLDQVHILGRWLRKHAGHPSILPIRGESPDWTALLAGVRALGNDDLRVDERSSDPTRDTVATVDGAEGIC